MSIYPFPRLMLGLHPLDFKDHPSLNKLHHLKSLTSNQCCRVAEPNAREHCNAFILRSGTQLEGPKGTSVGAKSQKEHDKGVTSLPCENKPQEKGERERPKESKSPSLKPYMLPCHFHKDFATANLDS